MCLLGIFLWIVANKLLCTTASICSIHDKCLADLKVFTHTDEFHVYTTLEEAEKACREAKDAYLCVKSAPECEESSERAELSPVFKGSFRLLKEFCGYKSKRRPCCALRMAYLEHSSCYEEMREKLYDCNEKYRRSLAMILNIEGEHERKKQRFCSVKWFGNCLKEATQSYCGKVAAKVIRTYMMKAGKPEKIFLEGNEECRGTPYGYEEDRAQFCRQKNFQKCQVHLLFLREYLIDDRLTDDEKFLSICKGIHDSLECLSQAFKKCFSSHQKFKFEKLLENEACPVKENLLLKYRGKIECLAQQVHEFSQCQEEVEIPFNFANQSYWNQYSRHFCGFLNKIELCWIEKASSLCGNIGKTVMNDIIKIASMNQNCKDENFIR